MPSDVAVGSSASNSTSTKNKYHTHPWIWIQISSIFDFVICLSLEVQRKESKWVKPVSNAPLCTWIRFHLKFNGWWHCSQFSTIFNVGSEGRNLQGSFSKWQRVLPFLSSSGVWFPINIFLCQLLMYGFNIDKTLSNHKYYGVWRKICTKHICWVRYITFTLIHTRKRLLLFHSALRHSVATTMQDSQCGWLQCKWKQFT